MTADKALVSSVLCTSLAHRNLLLFVATGILLNLTPGRTPYVRIRQPAAIFAR
jgi:hypothetical protein